eukprot:snap_masked-scaffold_10-processed-gene-13.27-mRNA-1 protein AED:1.00 eAED:1.00 QI:0/0/0/0/1/1/4/0/127
MNHKGDFEIDQTNYINGLLKKFKHLVATPKDIPLTATFKPLVDPEHKSNTKFPYRQLQQTKNLKRRFFKGIGISRKSKAKSVVAKSAAGAEFMRIHSTGKQLQGIGEVYMHLRFDLHPTLLRQEQNS